MQSGMNGTAVFGNLTQGVYQIDAVANNHQSASAVVTVVGPTSAQLLLALEPVQVHKRLTLNTPTMVGQLLVPCTEALFRRLSTTVTLRCQTSQRLLHNSFALCAPRWQQRQMCRSPACACAHAMQGC